MRSSILLTILVAGCIGGTSITGFTSLAERPFTLTNAAPLAGPLIMTDDELVEGKNVVITVNIGEVSTQAQTSNDCTDGCGVYVAVPLRRFNATGVTFSVDVPSGLDVSGTTTWTGDLGIGEMKTLSFVLTPQQSGEWEIQMRTKSGTINSNPEYTLIESFHIFYDGQNTLLSPTGQWCEHGQLDVEQARCVAPAAIRVEERG